HLARLACGRKGRIQATEVGSRTATAMTRSAVVTRGAAVMTLRQYGRTAYGHHPVAAKVSSDRLLNSLFRAGHFHRRQKLTIWQLRQAFGLAADADEGFHIVVPRGDIVIANRPINRYSVTKVSFEIQIAPAV